MIPIYLPRLTAPIRVQMIKDINSKVNQYEIRSKAAQSLIEGCLVDNEIQASTVALQMYEDITHMDIPLMPLIDAPIPDIHPKY